MRISKVGLKGLGCCRLCGQAAACRTQAPRLAFQPRALSGGTFDKAIYPEEPYQYQPRFGNIAGAGQGFMQTE